MEKKDIKNLEGKFVTDICFDDNFIQLSFNDGSRLGLKAEGYEGTKLVATVSLVVENEITL